MVGVGGKCGVVSGPQVVLLFLGVSQQPWPLSVLWVWDKRGRGEEGGDEDGVFRGHVLRCLGPGGTKNARQSGLIEESGVGPGGRPRPPGAREMQCACPAQGSFSPPIGVRCVPRVPAAEGFSWRLQARILSGCLGLIW